MPDGEHLPRARWYSSSSERHSAPWWWTCIEAQIHRCCRWTVTVTSVLLMPTHVDRWAELRAEHRWAELWADVEAHGSDEDVYHLMTEMAQTGVTDPEARAHAAEAFRRTAKGQAMHRRNVERARAMVAAGR